MTVIHSICCEAMSDNQVLTLFRHECQYKSEIGRFQAVFGSTVVMIPHDVNNIILKRKVV